VRQQFQIVANHGQAQFAVNRPISATAGAFVGLDLTDDGTALLAGPASTYAVTSLATRASQAELGAAGTGYPDALRAAYLQLPPSLPARVASLAAQIANGATNPYDQALQLQAYLRNTYTYRLDVPPPPAGRDAVDYFLYEAPGGFCSYYASAMAVMLRTLGVPARVATGYAMGDYDSGRDAYRVAGAAAHAWVEVYFPAYGWVEFEPTPARAVFERPLGAGLTPTGAAPGSGAVASPSQASRVIAVVLGAAVTLLAAAGWVWWQLAARREPETPRRQVLRLYGRMRSALARAGLDAKPSVTADEYLAGRFDDLSARPSLLAAISEATALYRQAAYSPHPVSEASARAAQRLWEAARPAWIGLVFQWLAKSLRRNAR
jgi:transglutaminase-like putative cysteine protease